MLSRALIDDDELGVLLADDLPVEINRPFVLRAAGCNMQRYSVATLYIPYRTPDATCGPQCARAVGLRLRAESLVRIAAQ
jgi:hypothetical protein